MKIIHISDLHVSSPNFDPEWGGKVVDHVNTMKPDLLLITGDLTNEGHIHEYRMWQEYFARFEVDECIIIPGNHDARNGGWELFEEMIGPRFPVWENEQVKVQGLDSSEPDLDDGGIGRESYGMIRKSMNVKGKVKIIMLHHHLVPIPGTGRERQIPTDAGDVLKIITDTGVHLVLSGHRHRTWHWKLQDTYLITSGTSTSRRLKGHSYPSFNIIDIEGDELSITEVNVETGENTTKLDKVKLNIQ